MPFRGPRGRHVRRQGVGKARLGRHATAMPTTVCVSRRRATARRRSRSSRARRKCITRRRRSSDSASAQIAIGYSPDGSESLWRVMLLAHSRRLAAGVLHRATRARAALDQAMPHYREGARRRRRPSAGDVVLKIDNVPVSNASLGAELADRSGRQHDRRERARLQAFDAALRRERRRLAFGVATLERAPEQPNRSSSTTHHDEERTRRRPSRRLRRTTCRPSSRSSGAGAALVFGSIFGGVALGKNDPHQRVAEQVPACSKARSRTRRPSRTSRPSWPGKSRHHQAAGAAPHRRAAPHGRGERRAGRCANGIVLGGAF